MKQQVSPIVAVIVILAVVGIAALAWIKFGNTVSHSEKGSPMMPADVAAEFQKRMGGSAGPGGAVTGPPATNGSGGAPMSPPAGTSGGGGR